MVKAASNTMATTAKESNSKVNKDIRENEFVRVLIVAVKTSSRF